MWSVGIDSGVFALPSSAAFALPVVPARSLHSGNLQTLIGAQHNWTVNSFSFVSQGHSDQRQLATKMLRGEFSFTNQTLRRFAVNLFEWLGLEEPSCSRNPCANFVRFVSTESRLASKSLRTLKWPVELELFSSLQFMVLEHTLKRNWKQTCSCSVGGTNLIRVEKYVVIPE